MPRVHARFDTRSHVARLNPARGILFAAALAAVLAAFFIARPKPTPGPALRDFESYYAAGATWHYEGDPYSREIWRTEKTIPGVDAARDELLPFVGPPFGLPLWSALAQLPWPNAVRLWGAVLAASAAALAFGSLRLAGRLGGPPASVSAVGATLAFVAGFGPLTSGIALGQVAVVASAAVALAPFALRPRGTAAAFGAAFVAALQPNLALALVGRLGDRRSWLAFFCAAFIAAGTSALATGGPAGFAHYVAILSAHAAAERFIAIQTTPAAVARALGASATAAATLGLVLAAVVAALLVAQYASRRYAPDARLALTCAALPLMLPFAHEHDFTIAFLPALVTVRIARGTTWVLGACGTLLVATDWLGLAQRPAGSAETALLAFAAALGCALLVRGPLRAVHGIPIAVAFAVMLVAPLAAAHPLPVWPDALGDFHASLRLPAASVWRLEQERSGIATLVPLWGWLRCASLAGCVLIWLAAGSALRLRSGSPGR